MLETRHSGNNRVRATSAPKRNHGPGVLVFDEMVPTPDRDAGSFRLAMILRTLAKWGQTVFVPLHPKVSPDYEVYLRQDGIEVVYPTHYKDLLKRRRFHVAILSRPDVARKFLAGIRRIDRNVRIVFDTVDLHHLRFEREYKLTGNSSSARSAARYRRIESTLARASDQTWCVSPKDKKVLQARVPQARIAIIPTIHPLRDRGKEFAQRNGLLFIGGFGHAPNRDAIHYFMREIFPLVIAAIPHAKFYVIGGDVPDEIASYTSTNVVITGYLKDVDAFFHGCRVFVAPLRYGAGVNGKVGHALSYGLPVVTTSIGAEGMRLRDGREALIEDDPRRFAEAAIRIYQDSALWLRLSDCGYAHIRERYTPEVVGKKIRQAIQKVRIQQVRAKGRSF